MKTNKHTRLNYIPYPMIDDSEETYIFLLRFSRMQNLILTKVCIKTLKLNVVLKSIALFHLELRNGLLICTLNL